MKQHLRTGMLIVALISAMAWAGRAHAQLFTLSGTVTDPLAAPVADVNLVLYDTTGNKLGIPNTVTDLTGFYAISGLPVGTYWVGFEPPTATGLLDTIQTGVVINGNVTLNMTLTRGNKLSGVVRDTTGQPIFGIDLNVYDQLTGDKLDTPGDNTDSAGFYDVVVPDGLFRLRWRSPTGLPWVPVEIENVTIANDTTIDINLIPGVIVQGTALVNTAGTVPVVNADFDFTNALTGLLLFTPNDNTDSLGNVVIVAPAGIYDVIVEPQALDQLLPTESLGIVITTDTALTFTLDSGIAISGTVSTAGGAGVADVDLDVRNSVTGQKLLTPSDRTDGVGFYQVLVPQGTFDISYQPTIASRLAPAELTGVTVTKDTVINVTVPDGVLLHGLVQNSGGSGIVGVDVDAKDPGTGTGILLLGDRTDAGGIFKVVLVPGSYDLEIEPPKDRRLAAQRLESFPLSLDSTFLLFTLDTGFAVSGTVRDSGGIPVVNVDVTSSLITTGDTVFTPGHNTDALGNYQIIVPAATYDLLYRPDSLSGINDSVLLAGTVVATDTIIDVQFTTGGTGGTLRGDVNQDGFATAADVVYLVNYVFKAGPAPLPDASEGDVNCDGFETAADVVFLVNYVFKAGSPPICF